MKKKFFAWTVDQWYANKTQKADLDLRTVTYLLRFSIGSRWAIFTILHCPILPTKRAACLVIWGGFFPKGKFDSHLNLARHFKVYIRSAVLVP